MVVDKIKNINLYEGLSDRIAKGLEVLSSTDFINLQDGKYEIDGENLFYLVQRYKTKKASEAKFEAHKNYIDIQAIIKGKEIIGFEYIDNLKEVVPYKEDVHFFATPEDYTEIELTEGMFAILYPGEAHMPLCDYDRQNDVLKIVVKIKV